MGGEYYPGREGGKGHDDPSVIRNTEQMEERLKQEGGEGWKKNLTPDQVAELEKTVGKGPRTVDQMIEELKSKKS